MNAVILILASLAFSLQSFAGANGSGGGMGVVCRNADHSIKSVELLDLWEARVIYSRIPLSSTSSVAMQVEENLQNLKNTLYSAEMCVGQSVNPCNGVQGPDALYKILKFQTDRFLAQNLPQIHRLKGATLKKTNDAFEVVTPSDCEIAQLVRYKDTTTGGDVLINQDLVDHMDKTNEAALYVHEAYYALLRGYHEKSSLRVRRAIGLTFSGHKFRTLESFLPNQYYECSDSKYPTNRIVVYEQKSGLCAGNGVGIQVVNLAGMATLDFEEPNSCFMGSLEQVFTKETPYESWRPFGSHTGFDYSVYVSVGGKNGSKLATIQLTDAPDQPTSEKIDLQCTFKKSR